MMLIQIEVSVDHAKGVMNFIDETAWNLVHVYRSLQKSPEISCFLNYFLVAWKFEVREVKLHVCRIGDIAQGHWILGEKDPVELSVYIVLVVYSFEFFMKLA